MEPSEIKSGLEAAACRCDDNTFSDEVDAIHAALEYITGLEAQVVSTNEALADVSESLHEKDSELAALRQRCEDAEREKEEAWNSAFDAVLEVVNDHECFNRTISDALNTARAAKAKEATEP